MNGNAINNNLVHVGNGMYAYCYLFEDCPPRFGCGFYSKEGIPFNTPKEETLSQGENDELEKRCSR